MRRRSVLIAIISIASVAAGLAGVSGQTQKADETKQAARVTLSVTGMTCGGCEVAVRMAAQKVNGVKEAIVSYEKRTAEVIYDPLKTTPQAIAKAITERSGFKAQLPKTQKK